MPNSDSGNGGRDWDFRIAGLCTFGAAAMLPASIETQPVEETDRAQTKMAMAVGAKGFTDAKQIAGRWGESS